MRVLCLVQGRKAFLHAFRTRVSTRFKEYGFMVVMPDARPKDLFLTADQVDTLWPRNGFSGRQAACEAERLASSAQA